MNNTPAVLSADNKSKITLSNGIRILLDPMPQVRSASVGVYIDAGSANELDRENGIAHFIEHMLFKGTSRHNATELAYLQNLIGGQINAYTNNETLCLHARVVDDQLEQAIDILSEMLLDSRFAPEEIERERTVILDEIAMCEDDPEEAVMDLFMNTLYPNHPLGRPIVGTPETVGTFTRDHLFEFINREFTADRFVISVAGNFDTDRIVRQMDSLFHNLKPAGDQIHQLPLTQPQPQFIRKHITRHLQQTHLCLGGEAPYRTHPDRPGFSLLMMALGGSTSSRIFQQIREKHGLAYNIGATAYPARTTGCYIIDGATTTRNVPKVIDLCMKEIASLETNPIAPDELDIARRQMRAGLLLGLESTNARMSRAADTEITYGRIVPMQETLDRLEEVTPERLTILSKSYLENTPYSLTTIGPGSK